MQDKLSIGPVTIVQLVGINAKPRIASVQTDAAVRAADLSPPSAAAGISDEIVPPVTNAASSFYNIKVAPALGLSADPLRNHISLESGVDRPVVDASAPEPAIDPSTFDEFLPEKNVPDRSDGPQDEITPPDQDSPISPGTTDNNPADTEIVISATAEIFDGVEEFGDDQILDFTMAIDKEVLQDSISSALMDGSSDYAIFAQDGIDDWFGFAIIDCAGCISPEPQLMNNDFIAPTHQLSATDAVPLI